MKNLLSLIALVLIAMMITCMTGCNTISGAGKDMSAAGHDVTKAANKTQAAIKGN